MPDTTPDAETPSAPDGTSSFKPIPDQPITNPKWHIVIPTKNGDGTAEGLWEVLADLVRFRRDVVVSVVDSHDEDTDYTAYAAVVGRLGFRYVHLPCNDAVVGMTFNWPLACSGGASLSSAPYLLFLHDDVTPPPSLEGEWLDALSAALDTIGVGLAVPTLSGDCGNPVQGLDLPADIPFVDTAEFISGAALAVKRETLATRPLDTEMGGYEWAQVLLQWQLAADGLKTVVVPAAAMHHEGGGTYDRKKQDAAMVQNGDLYCRKAGNQKHEHNARPSHPRIAPKIHNLHGAAYIPTASLCFIVDGDAAIDAALRRVGCLEYTDVLVVDTSPSAGHAGRITQAAEDNIQRMSRLRPSCLRYLPAWDDDPVRQAIGSAYCEDVTVYDLRSGHAIPPVPFTGRRLRIGAHYDLPSRLEWLEVGLAKSVGLGDTMMLTPALHAFRAAFPRCKVRVHHCWDAGLALSGNPDIDEIRIVKPGESLPLEMFNAGEGAGSEGTVRQMFVNLGVAPPQSIAASTFQTAGSPASLSDDAAWEKVDRRLRYHFLPGERETASILLSNWAGDNGPELLTDPKAVVVAIQLHGGWQSKRWANVETLIRQVTESGFYALVVGNDEERMLPLPEIDRVIRMKGATIREMIAVLHLCDVAVGFDSGFIYSAAATKFDGPQGRVEKPGTPTVSLWGPHNPHGLLADTQPVNAVMLRVLTPKICKETHGTNCRETSGGSKCPLRTGPGGDCFDAITPCSVYDEVVLAPKWCVPIVDRW